jgi:hypothetical protein
LLETDHATVDQNVDQQQFQQLPINGRNFTSLTVLAPAISTYPQNNVNPNSNYTPGTNDVPGGMLFASGGEVNGQQDNGYYINGVNATANYGAAPSFAPSAEAIQDAKIAVADFSASNGHDISALLVSTKSGTSTYHGDAFEFVENDMFNARNPYDKALGLFSKSTLRRNQFGGNLGGPVRIPKLFNQVRNRAFFFANYERLEERDGLPNTVANLPSLAERQGDFSELLTGDNPVQLYNPYTTTYDSIGLSHRLPVPGNRLDLATRPDGGPLVDPSSAAISNLYPAPNTPNTAGFNTLRMRRTILLGSGFAIFVIPQVLTTIGWRGTFIATGLIAAGVLVLLLIAVPPQKIIVHSQGGFKDVFRSPQLLLLGLMHMASLGLLIVVGTWIALLLQQNLGLPVTEAGILGSMPLLLGIISRPLGGLVAASTGARPLLVTSFVMTALGCFLLAAVTSYIPSMVGIVLIGSGCGLPFATLFKRAAALFPGSAGAAMGLVNMMGIAMIVVGAPLAGYAAQLSGSYRLSFGALGLFSLTVGAISFLIRDELRG